MCRGQRVKLGMWKEGLRLDIKTLTNSCLDSYAGGSLWAHCSWRGEQESKQQPGHKLVKVNVQCLSSSTYLLT